MQLMHKTICAIVNQEEQCMSAQDIIASILRQFTAPSNISNTSIEVIIMNHDREIKLPTSLKKNYIIYSKVEKK